MWYALFFAALLSTDSLGVGLALGTKGTKIPLCAKLVAMAVSFGFAALSCFVGLGSGALLDEKFCRISGGILLAVSGIVLFLSALKGDKKDSDRDGSGEISVKEAVLMGVALSSDMLGAGTGFACGEKGVLLFPVFAGAFQFCFLTLGHIAGRKIKVPLWMQEKVIPYLAPVVIIILGVLKTARGIVV